MLIDDENKKSAKNLTRSLEEVVEQKVREILSRNRVGVIKRIKVKWDNGLAILVNFQQGPGGDPQDGVVIHCVGGDPLKGLNIPGEPGNPGPCFTIAEVNLVAVK
jgi:hypothetical protein